MAAALGAYLARQVDAGVEQQDVLTYGALVLLLHGSTLLVTVSLAWLAGLLPQVVVVVAVWAVIRHATGGAHFSSPRACLLATTATFLCAAATSVWLEGLASLHPWLAAGAGASTSAAAIALVFAYAPAEAAARPLAAGHRQRMRRTGRALAILMGCLVMLGVYLHAWWTFPTSLSFLLQSVTLTPTGHRAVQQSQNGLANIFGKGGKSL